MLSKVLDKYSSQDSHTQTKTSILRSRRLYSDQVYPTNQTCRGERRREKREEIAEAKPTTEFYFLSSAQVTSTSDCRRKIPEDRGETTSRPTPRHIDQDGSFVKTPPTQVQLGGDQRRHRYPTHLFHILVGSSVFCCCFAHFILTNPRGD
jgi:hypothetical protein